MEEREILNQLGLCHNKIFSLKELNGKFRIDFERRCVYDATTNRNGCDVVKGVYQTLLRNKYTVVK